MAKGNQPQKGKSMNTTTPAPVTGEENKDANTGAGATDQTNSSEGSSQETLNSGQNGEQASQEEGAKGAADVSADELAKRGEEKTYSEQGEAPKEPPSVQAIEQDPPLVKIDEEVEVAPAIDTSADGLQLSVFATRIAFLKDNGTDNEKHVITALERYVDVCSKTIDMNRVAIEQQRLWRLFEYIHNKPEEFSKLYSLVLEFAKEYRKTVFHTSMFFRAQNGLTLGKEQLLAFDHLRTLITNTVDNVGDRSKIKALIDIGKIVNHDCIPEHIRGQYVAFYN